MIKKAYFHVWGKNVHCHTSKYSKVRVRLTFDLRLHIITETVKAVVLHNRVNWLQLEREDVVTFLTDKS